ncbi:ABC transporter permease [Streptomyces sp. NPDC004393]|uniref:ABC transporter permease n=1 Tax=Streptomyces sp. NPDC004533 TaxID=3154278 RepID=UPI0033BDF42C
MRSALTTLGTVLGIIGIANVTLVTVIERTGEIGLRRALGASRRQVAGQLLVESTTIGLLGGVVGAALGMVVVVAVSAVREWTPVLDVRLALGAPVAGALVGLLAGLYPSLRAARMEPVDALRS